MGHHTTRRQPDGAIVITCHGRITRRMQRDMLLDVRARHGGRVLIVDATDATGLDAGVIAAGEETLAQMYRAGVRLLIVAAGCPAIRMACATLGPTARLLLGIRISVVASLDDADTLLAAANEASEEPPTTLAASPDACARRYS